MADKRRSRKKKTVQSTLYGALALVLALAVYFVYPYVSRFFDKEGSGGTTVTSDGELAVHFIDIGQGDAILLRFPTGENMLIDTGDRDGSNTLVKYLQSQSVKTLDYLVLTHPDSDHIGEAYDVLSNFTVKNLWMSSKTSTTKTYLNILEKADELGLEIETPFSGDVFTVGEGKFTVLSPVDGKSYGNTNNASIVMKFEYGSVSVMFTGDAESPTEDDILSAYGASSLRCDILKCGHHGSSSSTSQAFLNAVAPRYAVISCGAGNTYGHPHRETMEKLNAKGIEILRTDTQGTIVIKTDGSKIDIIKG
ncbi:MAG: MBL fold metallo-hydrolase [Clostridia bacterium]|nr:MBL fold metallo-hydrolase [Clostridia bacterium]